MEQYNVTGMSCAACSARVEKAVSHVPGVTSCSVSLLTNSMGFEGTASPAEIIAAVGAGRDRAAGRWARRAARRSWGASSVPAAKRGSRSLRTVKSVSVMRFHVSTGWKMVSGLVSSIFSPARVMRSAIALPVGLS